MFVSFDPADVHVQDAVDFFDVISSVFRDAPRQRFLIYDILAGDSGTHLIEHCQTFRHITYEFVKELFFQGKGAVPGGLAS